VEVAPQVSGVVNHVDVANDQKVAVGDLLATLDPEPFALSVDLDQKRLDGAVAAAKVKEEEARVPESALETAKAAVTLAQQDYDRIAALVKQRSPRPFWTTRGTTDRRRWTRSPASKRNCASMRGKSPQRSRKWPWRKRNSRSPNTIWRGRASSRPSQAL
jgi:pyruvate/2-oxoglutarate dehydrogenase complex dihydrolipoamide acyltransferase (E2) component